MRRFRLRITWSNGHSDYIGGIFKSDVTGWQLEHSLYDRMKNIILAPQGWYVDGGSVYNISQIRKAEWEEMIEEQEVKI